MGFCEVVIPNRRKVVAYDAEFHHREAVGGGWGITAMR